MRLLSWIGTADYMAWKNDRRDGDGPLLAIARKVEPTHLDVLWDDGGVKVPLSDAQQYQAWLMQQLAAASLRPTITIHPCQEAKVVDFAWVYGQIERLAKVVDLEDGQTSVNASSGTWVMSACWIVFKKATGLNLHLYQSSKEGGVVPVQLPPNLAIDMAEVVQGRLSPLFDAHLRGDLRINLPDYRDWIMQSPRMKETLFQAHLVAKITDVPVLLLGPPGVGKSRIAKMIHELSGLAAPAWVTVDCGTLLDARSIAELWGWEKGAFTGATERHEALITAADKGTVFFDEVGNAPAMTQQNLLRLLQEKKYRPAGAAKEQSIETRVIAATNSDLREKIRDGSFRQDLFDRLSGFVIDIPPLKDHPEDIVPLSQSLLRKFNDSWGQEIKKQNGSLKVFTAEAQRELQRYDWPGNVRELENVVKRIAILTIYRKDDINGDDVRRELTAARSKSADAVLGKSIGGGFKLQDVLNDVSFHYVRMADAQARGNKSEMAELLGYGRTNRTPLLTILKNLKAAHYDVEPTERK